MYIAGPTLVCHVSGLSGSCRASQGAPYRAARVGCKDRRADQVHAYVNPVQEGSKYMATSWLLTFTATNLYVFRACVCTDRLAIGCSTEVKNGGGDSRGREGTHL